MDIQFNKAFLNLVTAITKDENVHLLLTFFDSLGIFMYILFMFLYIYVFTFYVICFYAIKECDMGGCITFCSGQMNDKSILDDSAAPVMDNDFEIKLLKMSGVTVYIVFTSNQCWLIVVT